MGWKRIGNHSYLYRSRREGGRIVSEYVGRGEDAALIDRMERIDRQRREDKRADERAERETVGREERAIRDWFEAVEVMATGAMLAAGFHKHHGQWRRTRHGEVEIRAPHEDHHRDQQRNHGPRELERHVAVKLRADRSRRLLRRNDGCRP